ncbi:MAG: hypothetical protein PHR43_01445 [Dehalococcoidales bacterium]|nr:hypothetical protein [Dehalococcoidales bacterium]
MVQFLNTAQTYSEIESIVTKAENKLVLISPFLSVPELMVERLRYAAIRHNLPVTVVCRLKKLKKEERKSLKRVCNLKLLDLPNLHAKCFYNEQSMVITSLNLYDFSRLNNREMGILLTKANDTEVFNEAMSEAEFIVQTAVPETHRVFSFESTRGPSQLNKWEHNRKRNSVGSPFTADVGLSLKRAFPTFSKLLGFTGNRNRF